MDPKEATGYLDPALNDKPAYSGRRLGELDSLRGLAAITVAMCHVVLGWLSISPPTGTTAVLLKVAYPLYAGPEAVRLFFVLSGMVLAISLGYQKRPQSYRVFITRRIVRIYLPYLCALGLSVWGASILHGPIEHSTVKNCCWSEPANIGLIKQHLIFLGDYDYAQLNPVIWSLVHEMRISILFPFLFLLVQRLSNRKALALAGLCTISTILLLRFGPPQVSTMSPISYVMTLHFIALFIMGILLARNMGEISSWYAQRSRSTKWVLFLASFMMYNFSAVITQTYFGAHLKITMSLSDWGTALGACGVIITCHCSLQARHLLAGAIVRFFGRISYSLYLVHMPILFALYFVFQHRGLVRAEIIIPVYMVTSVVVAYLFCRAIEEPCVHFGRYLTKRFLSSDGSWMQERLLARRTAA